MNASNEAGLPNPSPSDFNASETQETGHQAVPEAIPAETTGNGWTKERIAVLGIPWPPVAGWAKELIRKGFSTKWTTYDEFMAFKASGEWDKL